MDFEPFLTAFETTRKCSVQTIKAYRSDLRMFEAFLRDQSIFRLSQVNHATISDYIKHMREKANPRFNRMGLRDSSIARRLAAVSSYFAFVRATSEEKLNDPFNALPTRWQQDKTPKPVDDLTLDLLITGMSNLRDRTLFTLFLSTGLRISEMQQLNCDSIIVDVEGDRTGKEHFFGSGEVVGKGN